MDLILQSMLDLPGVGAALVLDGQGTLVGHRGRGLHDRARCESLGGALARAVEAVQRQQEDWESISARYADGQLLLRNLGGGAGRLHLLALVADRTLDASAAAVALRVAANKLRRLLSRPAGPPAS